jgi:hypothetical protein
VRHITVERLTTIDALLERIRGLDGLVERKPGIFYRRSRAFLHFHEHGDDVFADVKLGGDGFERHKVTTAAEQNAFFQRVRTWLSEQA